MLSPRFFHVVARVRGAGVGARPGPSLEVVDDVVPELRKVVVVAAQRARRGELLDVDRPLARQRPGAVVDGDRLVVDRVGVRVAVVLDRCCGENPQCGKGIDDVVDCADAFGGCRVVVADEVLGGLVVAGHGAEPPSLPMKEL